MGAFSKICKIQKLCSIGKSWKPLRKREAGDCHLCPEKDSDPTEVTVALAK